MKSFWAVVLLGFALLAPAYAQQDVDEKYLWIYSLIQQGETLVSAGDSRAALPVLLDAQSQLQKFQKLYPDWNPGLVRFRLNGVTEKIAGLKATAAMSTPPPTRVDNAAAPAVTPQAQVDRLTAQLQNAQADNEALQAKLKEALSAQPAAADADELARLKAQFQYLMKENELLKASAGARGTVAVKDTDAVARMRRELAAVEKQSAGQQARADQLAAENAQLQKNSALNATTLDALRDQNRKLTALLAAPAATVTPASAPANAAALSELSTQLHAAHSEIANLKLSAVATAQEKDALRDKNRKLNALLAASPAAPASASTNAAALTELSAQLDAARAEIVGLKSSVATTAQEKDELREQNRKLNALLTASPAAPAPASTHVATLTEPSAQPGTTPAEIAGLKASIAAAALEKAALEKKLNQVSAELADLRAANYEARIRDLTAARDDLQKQLKVVAVKDAGLRPDKDQALKDASLAALNAELATLRARVAVAEVKAVPFSPEELTLMQPAAPQLPVATPPVVSNLPPGTAELTASAQRHFSRHEFTAAEADYEQILAREPNNGLMLANLATIELQEDKLADAEKHITAAVAQSPNDAYNLATLGYLKFRQEKYDDALNILSRAAVLDPRNPEIQNYLGVTLSHKGQRLQAEAVLRQAIQLNPLYAPAHNNLAVIYLTQQPPSPLLARWHYQKAVASGQPRNPDFEKLLADRGAPVTP
jgi:Tfp pilus assembly protein PilF/regulator of replication initiation timing